MQIFREKSQLLIEINEKVPFNHLGLILIDIMLGTHTQLCSTEIIKRKDSIGTFLHPQININRSDILYDVPICFY